MIIIGNPDKNSSKLKHVTCQNLATTEMRGHVATHICNSRNAQIARNL